MSRLPEPGKDAGTWGAILNDYLLKAHSEDGSLKPGIVTNASLAEGTIQESKLHNDVRAKLNAVDNALVESVAGKTGIVTLTKNDVGLTNIDNTSDLDKPISSATQTALDTKQIAGSYAASKRHDGLSKMLGELFRRTRIQQGQATAFPVMGSPPPVSISNARQYATEAPLEWRVAPNGSGNSLREVVKVRGGTLHYGGTTFLAPVVTLPTGTGNTITLPGLNRNSNDWFFEFMYNSRYLEIMLARRGGQKFQISIDGERISAAALDHALSGADTYVALDLGSVGTRRVRVETSQSGGLVRIYTASSSRVYLPVYDQEFCMVSLGDSVASGTGAPSASAWQTAFMKRMGLTDSRMVALGGSGFLNPGTNESKFGDAARLMDVYEAKPDLIMFNVTINDTTLHANDPALFKATVIQTMQEYRSQHPDVPIFLGSMWPGEYPGGTTLTRRQAMEADAFDAFEEWADPNSWAFENFGMGLIDAAWLAGGNNGFNSDASHPNAAGHLYIAEWWIAQIQSRFSISL